MFNKKIFCNRLFFWIVIAIGITAACISGQHEANAATLATDKPAAIKVLQRIAIKTE